MANNASEMFGTPIGVMAYEDQANQNALASIKAAEELGKIAMMPAERAQKEAHARLYLADARQKEEAVKAAESIAKLNADFVQADANKNAAIQSADAQGRIATINDMPPGPGQPAQNSQAGRLQRFLAYAENNKVPESDLVPYRKELALILKDEAIASYDNSRAMEQQQLTRKHQANARSNMAAAILANPAQYPQALAQALNDPDPAVRQLATGLPQAYSPLVAGFLDRVRLQGIEAEKQADIALRAAKEKRDAAREPAEIAAIKQRTALAASRTKYEDKKFQVLEKYTGPTSNATIEQKKVKTAAAKAEMEARELERYPLAPLDKNARKPERTYTLPDKSRWTWRKNPATGEFDWWRPEGVSGGELLQERSSAGEEG